MKVIANLLYTEPVFFLSAVAGIFTVGGAVAVALGVTPAVGIACGVIGPAVAGAARKWAYSPQSVAAIKRKAVPVGVKKKAVKK